MSLMIKGMELPDSCLNCQFRTTMLKNVLSPTGRTSVYACLIGGMDINIWIEEQHNDCPLIEIPTPHGRLIDADALLRTEINLANYPSNYIHIAPTIIEAEVSE